MVKSVAFFPWWNVSCSLSIGPIRLIAYSRGKSPGDFSDASQAEIDGVLGAYANRPRQRVKHATILEVDDWRTGEDAEPVLSRLFAAREALGFAALAERRLFVGHFHYCCFDTFALVVQRYSADHPGRLAYTTRRRDGGATNMWGSDNFAFQCPLHVYDFAGPPKDTQLVALLMDDVPGHWLDAVAEFNRANTDSLDVMPHVEVVMMKSAFEWLLKIGSAAPEFSAALERCLSGIPTAAEADGPLLQKWRSTWPKCTRPVLAWAREFCALRGISAHGSRKSQQHFVWTEASHLAFASMLFPLLFKQVVADAGRYILGETDRERLSRIDQYVLHDPMTFDEDDYETHTPHPWASIDDDARMAELGRLAYEALERGLAEAAGAAESGDEDA